MTREPEDRMPEAVREAARDDRPMPDPEALFAQLQTQLDTRPRLARLADMSTHGRVALCLALGLLTAVISLRGPVTEPADLLATGLYFVTAMWLMLAALRPLQRPAVDRNGLWLRVGSGAAVVIGLAILPELLSDDTEAPPLAGALACLGIGTAYALPTFVALRLLDRGQRLGPWLSALAAGVVGNLALHLHCPAHDATHRVLGHALVLGTAAGLAAAAVGLSRRFRSAP